MQKDENSKFYKKLDIIESMVGTLLDFSPRAFKQYSLCFKINVTHCDVGSI